VGAEFVALADLLRAPVACADAVQAPVTRAAPRPTAAGDEGVFDRSFADAGAAEAVAAGRDARLFRARLADAFDEAAARLLRELASDVLARELRLAPCDLAELVRRACERAPVVRVRVASCDVARVRAGAPRLRGEEVQVVEDFALAGGDVVIEVAGGALDARLGVRLATVLEAFA
jgi:flagellar biosynthesis/type III secretory pathway protein FliH